MKKQGFLKGSAILLGMVIFTKAVGLAYKIPLTHLLGGRGMAYYSGAFAVFAPLLAVSSSGITASVARLTAESYALGRYAQARKVRRCALLVYSLLGLTVGAVLCLTALPLAETFLHERRAFLAIAALSPLPFFAAVLNVRRGYYEGLSNMLPTASSEIAETVIKAVLGLFGAWGVMYLAESQFSTGGGCFGEFCRTIDDAQAVALPYAAAAAILAGSLSTGFAALYITLTGRLRGDGITDEMLRSDPVTDSFGSTVKRLFACSLPISCAAVITTLTGTFDLMTITSGLRKTFCADPEFVYGSYTGLALMICGLVPTLTAMFGKSALPALTEAASRRDGKALSRSITDMLRVTLLISLPCGMLITALPREVLTFLFAGRNAEIDCTVVPMCILGTACVFMSLALPCLSALQTLGMWRTPIVLMLTGGAVKLTGNLILIPLIGISGAAVSTAASQMSIAIPAVLVLLRRTDTKILKSVIIVKPVFGALLCAVTARLVCGLCGKLTCLHIPERLICPVSAIAGLLIYILVLWLTDTLPNRRVKAYFLKKFRKTY